ncbi:uncharacterized protein LOC134020626 [Osmerus eperlanus]|uniref:uncharacterized protein LOC134020626 n=1 Tax=Osmerus eperlanus TaxID=29151 RepID=UPI002E0D79BC
MEWAICRYEVDKMCQEQPFVCPPCTPEILAVAVDGNRKHYLSRRQGGVFLCEDSKVSEFVDHVHKATKHVSGKGVCGGAEFAAAKEISRKSSSKLDEEGIELAVCRHDQMVWGVQENAACTLGEEVEQANAFLFRIAISTKYTSKAARTDMITLLCMGWNQAKVQHMSSYLSRRFLKTKQSLQQQKDSLEALTTELSVDNSTILQWVTDVQGWAESAPVEDSDAPVELQKKMEEMSASIRQRTHLGHMSMLMFFRQKQGSP